MGDTAPGLSLPERQISEAATIADVVDSLADPVGYLRGVLNNLHECRREFGFAAVRIGITGKGIVPHYRVEKAADALSYLLIGVWKTFNGQNHKTLIENEFALQIGHWSTRTMTLDEVAALLGKLRGFRRI